MAYKWFYLGEYLPIDGHGYYFRLANNEFWPFFGTFDAVNLRFYDEDTGLSVDATKVIRIAPTD